MLKTTDAGKGSDIYTKKEVEAKIAYSMADDLIKNYLQMMGNNNTNKKKWWKIRLLFVPEGAFLFWALKGFKGTFDEEYI